MAEFRIDPEMELPVLPSRARADVSRKPEWLKINLRTDAEFVELKRLMRGQGLHTVCEEARCPNIFECWNRRTATFMILGDICTRNCGFCAVRSGVPTGLDLAEPERVADACVQLGLRHVVVTSVARDDLSDGGASIFAETIRAIRRKNPFTGVEVLIPDFGGNWDALAVVMDAEPDVLNHNIETVRRLSDRVRSRAKYDRSLELLRRAKEMKPHVSTKSSIMVGLGETMQELYEAMDDLRAAGVDIVTFGQYLRPTARHLAVEKFYTPAEFEHLREEALKRGFAHCESGPLVRSSYHADEQSAQAVARRTGAGRAAQTGD
ncbi:lipoyl synthase [Symbiobacterium thermophilum]|uniref:Lipoyl synthase n=1 Tax=Symbiobacterium thermophilum (strain DSM 24528 / JCM 14929 / IAM 14863 / T) TaxID=292459 RepID=LIPA_SYMTH|nr:lipoyl synthase [Symbiobacterium thermophilum]Q67MF5.1 RecName: Full=Lipoyl synthase; AltName: Full=Lip-syn; Short=LS; AltName: Full=Lipoate synthase; AltName: Full=Lipoic acid synthase; AltName: Full=Sulfur insertion protein LipA [Symbiobacterium thermophilum IAM 14863]BAD41138.1 lipoic acid synthetase [Symbiobacterium thermophilum IAM 14863]